MGQIERRKFGRGYVDQNIAKTDVHVGKPAVFRSEEDGDPIFSYVVADFRTNADGGYWEFKGQRMQSAKFFTVFAKTDPDGKTTGRCIATNQDPAEASRLVSLVDGVVISGGDDTDPPSYGAEVVSANGNDPAVDGFEVAVVEAAREQDKPVLAICRGLQVLNVAMGGTLAQEVTAEGAIHELIDKDTDPEEVVGWCKKEMQRAYGESQEGIWEQQPKRFTRLFEHEYGPPPTRDLAIALMLLSRLQRPLLVEGDAGVGKTEIAKALSKVFDCPLIRLQCYEGLDANSSVYEWNYQHQLLSIKLLEQDQLSAEAAEQTIFSRRFLLERPLLAAITQPQSPVLLIDEIDKAETDFQDDMLDILDQMQFDIIETDDSVHANKRPVIIITSNAKKDLSDPFLGRCNFHHIAFPDPKMMRKIVDVHFPGLDENLAREAITTFYKLREIEGIEKRPATRELINWLRALAADPDFKAGKLIGNEAPFLGVLFKKSSDYEKTAALYGQGRS